MEAIDIKISLSPATALKQFRTQHGAGPRINGMIYFIRLDSGELWLENIKEDTDVNVLQRQILEGRVFIVDKIEE